MRPDTELEVVLCPSANHEARDERLGIDMLLLHYTGMPDAGQALGWLCKAESKVSAHYFIYEDGRIVQMVPEDRRAWHAGAAFWAGERDINGCSIGIEIANEGPDSGCPEYPEAQMEAVIALARDIVLRRGIVPQRVLAHSDVAPGRKFDPGACFDWGRLYGQGIGHWVEPEPLCEGAALKQGKQVAAYQKMLSEYGYDLDISGEYCERTMAVTRAFQLHFRPELVDGIADVSSVLTLKRLVESM